MANSLSAINIVIRSSQRKATWLLAFISGLILISLYLGWSQSIDRWFYDRLLHTLPTLHQPTDVSHTKPVLIEIDEHSLEKLGRWPWSRQTHASLIHTLNAAPPFALAFDIVFAQPQTDDIAFGIQGGDEKMSAAIASAHYPIILAAQLDTVQGRTKLVLPDAQLQHKHTQLAHILASPDTDGVMRKIYLHEGFKGQTALPYLGLALHQPDAAPGANPLPNFHRPAQRLDNTNSPAQPYALWSRQYPLMLYPLSYNDYDRVSYIDVLENKVPKNIWQNRPVLVAATATGLGDQYVSPIYQAQTTVSGGEIVLASLISLQKIQSGAPVIQEAHLLFSWLLSTLVSFLMLLGLRRLNLAWQVLYYLTLSVSTYFFILYLFAVYGYWLQLGTCLLAIFSMFALWSFSRLSTALGSKYFFSTTLPHIAGFDFSRLFNQQQKQPNPTHDPVDQLLLTLAQNQDYQTAIRDTVITILQVLPDAAFVLSAQPAQANKPAQLWLANQAALELMHSKLNIPADQTAPTYTSLLASFNPILTDEQTQQLAGQTFTWDLLLKPNRPASFQAGVEATMNHTEVLYLIKVQTLTTLPLEKQAGLEQLFVMSIIDLSVSQQLTNQREASLQFLSHDIRTPQVAILSMIDLAAKTHPADKDVLDKIAQQAQRTLSLTDGFVQLARAEQSTAYHLKPYDLNDLATEACDELWAPATQKNIALASQLHPDTLLILADTTLFWRALVNILSNAVKYCPSGTSIHVQTTRTDTHAHIHITDNGPGIADNVKTVLVQTFNNSPPTVPTNYARTRLQGTGLGLTFVKTVIERHNAQVHLTSPCMSTPTAHGTQFTITIPLYIEPDTNTQPRPHTPAKD